MQGNVGFRQSLTRRQEAAQTLLCVGLDPVVEKIPKAIRAVCRSDAAAAFLHMTTVADATAAYASMFKPQFAHWLAIKGGVAMLRLLIAHIHAWHPGIPVLMDCKVGDIDRTQRQYGHAHQVLAGADGLNYNGWMGEDTLVSLINPNLPGNALVGLGRTSNPKAWDVQDALMADGRPLWEFMLWKMYTWSNEHGVLANAGVVMGAAYQDPLDANRICSDHLAKARSMVTHGMWFLIPGVGTQGGFVEETVRAAYCGPGSIAVNSSSGLSDAPLDLSLKEAAEWSASKARDLRDALNRGIPVTA